MGLTTCSVPTTSFMGATVAGSGSSPPGLRRGGGASACVPGQIMRAEFWNMPQETKWTEPPAAVTVMLAGSGKADLGTDTRSFVVLKTREGNYFRVVLGRGKGVVSGEMSKQDRVGLRMKKATGGARILRVAEGADIKPLLTPRQLVTWAEKFVEGNGAGDRAYAVDTHGVALYLWNRLVFEKKALRPPNRGWFGKK